MSKILIESDEFDKLKEKINELVKTNSALKEKNTMLNKQAAVALSSTAVENNNNSQLKKEISYENDI